MGSFMARAERVRLGARPLSTSPGTDRDDMRWTIPNLLTVLRLLAAPGVALAFVVFPRPLADWIAMSLFVMAALTDYVDGRLARAWQQESAFGRMLDPIADKAMVIIALAVIIGL